MSEGQQTDLRSLGEILRAARAAQSRSLEQISTATRISPRMIEALEADELDRLGTPVYAKGFVRTLARELHLDERMLVLKLEAQLAAGRGGDAGAAPRGATWRYEQVKVVRPVAAGGRRWPAWKVLVAAAILVLAVLGGIWLGRRGGGRPAPSSVLAPADRPALPATASVPEAQVAAPLPVATAPAADSLATQAAASTSPPATPAPPPATPAPLPVLPGPVPSTASANPAQEVVVFPDRGGLASIERTGVAPAPARLHFLDLRATGPVEIVVGIDGATPQRRVLDAGQSWKLSAREYFTLRLSDAAACEVWMDGAQQQGAASGVQFRVPAEQAP